VCETFVKLVQLSKELKIDLAYEGKSQFSTLYRPFVKLYKKWRSSGTH